MEGQPGDKQTVQMDIGIGVFDVKEKHRGLTENRESNQPTGGKNLDDQLPQGMGYHQTSTQPILRYMPNVREGKGGNDESDDSSSSHDDNLFVEFDSSDEEDQSSKPKKADYTGSGL